MNQLQRYVSAVRATNFVRRTGKISQFFGLVVESNGPDVFLGELCEIYSSSRAAPIGAEVVGLKDGKVLLMPYEDIRGISLGSEVIATGHSAYVPVGEALLGRVVDAFGTPIDGKPALRSDAYYPIYTRPINPLTRAKIREVLETGVKAIDCFVTLGRGQRVGIFSGSGVGKSTLLGMIGRNTNADVNVVALVGERGREVGDFIDAILGPDGLRRSVIVVATSDQPALFRSHAALAATAIAEYFRDQGLDVALTMDSVTRFAMAQREIGLAIGEPPTSRGYTPSVFAALPKLLERGGTSQSGGSITALYTVLVEGDDLNDPISDSIMAILDGHIVLSRELANSGQYPAIDILNSTSRLLPNLVNEEEMNLIQEASSMLNAYTASKDLVDIGAYKSGTNPVLDSSIHVLPEINKFLRQGLDSTVSRQAAMETLGAILSKKVMH